MPYQPNPNIHPDYTNVPTDVDPEEASRKWLCLNCYDAQRKQGSELCAECETLWEPECVRCSTRGNIMATETICDECFDPEADLSLAEITEDMRRRG